MRTTKTQRDALMDLLKGEKKNKVVSGRGAEPTPGQRLDISEPSAPLRDITSGRVVPRTLFVSEREDKDLDKIDSLSDSRHSF